MEDIFGQTLRDIAGSCSWFEVAEEAAIEKRLQLLQQLG